MEPKAKSLNDDYFIRNAILCWMHYYPNHKWTPIYKELSQRDSYVSPQPKPTPRPARRKKPNPKIE